MPALPRPRPSGRWLLAGALAAIVAVAVGLALGRGAASALLASDPAAIDVATGPPPPPPGFTTFRDPAGGFSISYPRSWRTHGRRSGKADLLAAGDDGASLLVRTVELGFELSPDGLPSAQALTRRLVEQDRSVDMLARPARLELGELPGYSYLYAFEDARSGRRGIHVHYFLFDGDRMVTLVLQALPAGRLGRATPVFDRIVSTFRAE